MIQEKCAQIRDSKYFERFIIGVILLAGVVIGLETSTQLMDRFGHTLHMIDRIILWIFVAEAVIKILAEGKRPWRYFFNGWNVFDFTIVAVCFMPFTGAWAPVLRLARILRTLRLISAVPRLQVLVGALINSIPSMFYVSILLGLHFYIFAVMGTMFFRGNDPGHFGDLGLSFLTLFRVVTLEDWTDVMYTCVYGSDVYPAQGAIPIGPDPHAFGWLGVVYFVLFVVVGAMVMINLFIGVILTSISEAQAEQLREKMHLHSDDEDEKMLHGIERVESELAELREALRRRSANGNGNGS